ncbi:hypothetical protein DOY81_008541, partial [Sarcophaga bullata]
MMHTPGHNRSVPILYKFLHNIVNFLNIEPIIVNLLNSESIITTIIKTIETQFLFDLLFLKDTYRKWQAFQKRNGSSAYSFARLTFLNKL